MPSRCIFFLSAFRAWSTLLSRTRTCTLAPSLFRGRVEVESPAITGLLSRAAIAEKGLRVHRSVPEMPAPWPFFHVGSGVSAIWLPHALDSMVSNDYFPRHPENGFRPWMLQCQNAKSQKALPRSILLAPLLAPWSPRVRPKRSIWSKAVPIGRPLLPKTTSRPATAPNTTSSRTRAGWPPRPPAMSSVCSRPAACRSPSSSRTARYRSSRLSATCCPMRGWCGAKPHGSYLKRNPHLSKGQLFPQALVEFYLKTKDKNWKGKPLIADDPFMQFAEDTKQIRLFNPAKPLQGQEPFLVLAGSEVFGRDDEEQIFPEMRRIARQAFLVLEKAWQLEGGTLVDLKVEFGFDAKGGLLLPDVIDNDSWRVLEGGSYIDKQVYRDGGALDDVVAKYRHVAEITSHFRVPRQRIVLWRGSEKDNTDAFSQALGELADMMTVVTCSVHKEPVNAAGIFHRMMQEIPDSVVIAYIGRSNGAGPTLSG